MAKLARKPLLAVLMVASVTGACGPGETAAPDAAAEELGPDGLPVVDGTTPLPEPLPAVAAQVNGQPVFTRNVALTADVNHAAGDTAEEKKAFAYRKALQRLIVRELLAQEALRRGLEPDQARFEAAYDEARINHKDDAAWAAFLEQQGMTEEQFRTELRLQQLVNALMIQVVQPIPGEATSAEARRYYDDNPEQFETKDRLRASHILLRIRNPDDSRERSQVRQRMLELREEVVAGAAFADLAREHSQDAGSAGKGGELQVFTHAQMDPAFADAAFALEPGELSEPVSTPFGFHLIVVHERLPSVLRPFEEIEQPLRAHVAQVQRQQAIQELVKQLRASATIETFL